MPGPRGSRWVAMRSCRVGLVHCEVIAGHREPLRATANVRSWRKQPYRRSEALRVLDPKETSLHRSELTPTVIR
jgi:hypothetical protein